MASAEFALPIGRIFESRGRSNQKNNSEKGDERKEYQHAGLRGNGSKKKDRIGRSHHRSKGKPRFRI